MLQIDRFTKMTYFGVQHVFECMLTAAKQDNLHFRMEYVTNESEQELKKNVDHLTFGQRDDSSSKVVCLASQLERMNNGALCRIRNVNRNGLISSVKYK